MDALDSISQQMQTEIFSTLLVFLASANREIVKSTLGYIKLSIHTLPIDLLRPHLKDLVPALLRWSHDHKNHFKAKVRHIFERMLRRFGWDEVYTYAGEGEAAKVLVNIKKRKERAKRRKNPRSDDAEEDEEAVSPQLRERNKHDYTMHRAQLQKQMLVMHSKTCCMAVKANSMTARTKLLLHVQTHPQSRRALIKVCVSGWTTVNPWIFFKEPCPESQVSMYLSLSRS